MEKKTIDRSETGYLGGEELYAYIGNLGAVQQLALVLIEQGKQGKKIAESPFALKDQQKLAEACLGGIDLNGNVSANAASRLYQEVVGLSLNPQEVAAYLRSGLDPSEHVSLHFQPSAFLQKVALYNQLLTSLFVQLNTPLQKLQDEEQGLLSPKEIAELVKNFWEAIIGFVAPYNQETAFLVGLRFIPIGYIKKIRPSFDFEKIADYLGLEIKWEPQSLCFKEQYRIIGFKEGGLAETTYKLNAIALDLLDSPVFRILGGPSESIQVEYRSRCREICPDSHFGCENLYWVDNDKNLSLHRYRGGSKDFRYIGTTTIISLLDSAAPELFCGLIKGQIQATPSFEFEIAKVGQVRTIYLRGESP